MAVSPGRDSVSQKAHETCGPQESPSSMCIDQDNRQPCPHWGSARRAGVATVQTCLHSACLPRVPKHILICPTVLYTDSGNLLWATDNLLLPP